MDRVFSSAATAGFRVVRTWAFLDGPGPQPGGKALQNPAGVHTEASFAALDYVLNQAQEHNVRLVLPFCNGVWQIPLPNGIYGGDGWRERPRLIGIDTPETHAGAKLDRDTQRTGQDRVTIQALGREAAAFTRRLVESKTVEVESDVEKRDRYGRRLAYLWLPHGQMVNVLIIREGYAQPLTVPPNLRYEGLLRACGP